MLRHLLTLTVVPVLVAGADSISGTVADPSGRPVPSAHVSCEGQTATTAQDGRFTIEGLPSCEATITSPGFDDARVRLEAGRDARIVLAISALNQQIVVSATRAPVAVEESGVSATVLTSTEIEARDFPQVPDLLREVPGLAVMQTSRRGGLTSVFTRGGASTGTLVLLDGEPMNEPGGGMNFAHLSSAGLERIEVVRGPESALFGAEAASGVIQLFTERGDPETTRPHGSVSYERGSFQTDRWMADLNGGLLNQIPRYGGTFYWRQVFNAISSSCTMIYGAMFDEMNEGTSMLKMAPTSAQLPVQATLVPVNLDGQALPSDWYLRLAGQAAAMLRGDIPLQGTIPISP